MILTIALRELRSLFLSPLAWAIYAVVFIAIGYIFSANVDSYITETQEQLKLSTASYGFTALIISGLYNFGNILLLLVVPLLTMRVISGERRSGVLSLYFSAPVSMAEIIIGKYLGIVIFLSLMIFLISLMPLSMLFFGSLDLMHFASIIFGSLLTASAFAAIGVYMSCLTKEPIVAAISGFGLFILLLLLALQSGQDQITDATRYISIFTHDDALNQGVFRISDIIYFLLVITLFLSLSIRRLDDDRLQR